MTTLGDLPLRQVPVIEPSASLSEAIDLMRAEPLKTVVLVGDGQYMGVFNAETLDSDLVPRNADPADLAVGPYIHPTRVVADPRMTVEAAQRLMEKHGLRAIPVVDNVTYLGVAVAREDLP